MSEKIVDIWAHALDRVMWCVPENVRAAVIERLSQINENRPRFMTFKEMVEADNEPSPHAIDEAASLMVQVLVRSITSENSEEDAAVELFRRHQGGAGDGWLPSYLEHLPGLKVDTNACEKIAAQARKSTLHD